jgi:subtilisin
MQKLSRSICSFIFLLIFFACNEEEAPKPADPDDCLAMTASSVGEPIDGEYIITLPGESSDGRIAEAAARLLKETGISPIKIKEQISGNSLHFLMSLTREEANKIANENRKIHIEPDRTISICGCLTVVEPRLVTWNVDRVGYGDGTGKTAWVMDTGIDLDHPDLTTDKSRSQSFITDNPSPEDDNGHGTHVAGIIGAKNNSIGTLGVASGATLVSLKILDNEGNGRLSSALKALAYLKTNGKAGDVVNISLTLNEISESLESEIRSLAAKGLYIAIAAGNDKKDAGTFSPARTAGANIYTVSAVDSLNRFASFSNFGKDVIDYAAPGVRILSTYIDGKYAIISGTSMASPHVSGLLLINNGKINSNGFAENDPDGQADAIAHQ